MFELNLLIKLQDRDSENRHNIIRYVEHFTFRGFFCTVMELLYFDVYTILKAQRFVGFKMPIVQVVAKETAEALQYTHSQGIVHCDIKPENILFMSERLDHVKLIDFGCSCFVGNIIFAYVQSRYYRAPEVVLGMTYAKEIDMWSLGCVIYEMLVGISPFYNKNVQQMYEAIENEPVKFPEIVSDTAMDLIDKLLAKDPGMRLGNGPNDAEEIKCHRFFKGIDWQAVYERKIEPLWRPAIRSETDTSMFDDEFTREPAVVSYESPVSLPTDSERLLEGFSYTNDGNGGEATCIPDDDDL